MPAPSIVYAKGFVCFVVLASLCFPSQTSQAQTVDSETILRILDGFQGKGIVDLNGDGKTTHVDLFLMTLSWFGTVTRLEATSPLKNEEDIAITRETILYFNGPLDPSRVNTDSISAEFGGLLLGTRLHLSPDQKTVTIFYNDPLPPSSRIRVKVDGNKLKNKAGLMVDVDRDGLPGGVEFIDFDTLTLTTLPGTAVCGRVFASELATTKGASDPLNIPLEGVRITVDGMEDTLFTMTDSLGNFRLEPAPAGKFFVHVDGRTVSEALIQSVTIVTSYPDGYYYPFVGKAWTSIPGREVNVGNIYLPLVLPGTLQPVKQDEDVTIPFVSEVLADHPEFVGTQVTVPADSLFADDGSRGGKVGIAPVPPDRLPGQLPPGLEFPLVITVQTDGATNFDVPAPVCFPNLPNPVSGQTLPPGAKSGLYSFNHDVGEFEYIGPMTVSQDGRLICTDPGVGVMAPGWHGSGPAPSSPPPPCPGGGGKSNKENHKGIAGPEIGSTSDFAEWYRRDMKIGHELLLAGLLKRAVVKHSEDKLGGVYLIPEGAGALFIKWLLCNPDLNPKPKQGSSQKTEITQPSSKGLLNNALLDELDEIFLDIVMLMYDHEIDRFAQGSQDPIPQDVVNQVYSKLNEADALVGGDVLIFLQQKKVELEKALQTSSFYIEGGMTVAERPYPIYFAASILRENSNLMLRGKTKPFNQYEIFVPQDGTLLQVMFYDAVTKTLGVITPNQDPDRVYSLPRSSLFSNEELTNPGVYEHPDTDQDGLPDPVELVVGTSTGNPDTDNDGVSDGAELDQGTDPLDGLPTTTGIIATVDTPGTAVDIVTGNNLVLVADSNAGLSVFNVFNGMNPVVIAQVDTPGTAQRVASSGQTAVVADGPAGLAVIDLSDPPAAGIINQIPLKGVVMSVAMGGNTAYAGLESGDLVWVDIPSAEEVGRTRLGGPIQDVAIQGTFIYALTPDRLYVLNRFAESIPPMSSASSPFLSTPNSRLFVGGNLAYTVHGKGYNTFGLSDPANPILLGQGNTAQFGWKQIVDNGSGIGVAAVGDNFSFDGPHNISLYDISNPTETNKFITTYVTPGIARAVSIYNGLAYVADHHHGMQVLNYIQYDSLGLPPILHNLKVASQVEELQPYQVTVDVTDDVQVRNVEFYVDGNRVATDGNFPFEVSLIAPALVDQTSLTLQVRASDTGGNFVLSATRELQIIGDKTPPRVRSTLPSRGALVSRPAQVIVLFSEAIDPTTLDPTSLQVYEAGQDGIHGTNDDVIVTGGSRIYNETAFKATLIFQDPLAPGRYRIVVGPPIIDLAGNPLSNVFVSTFQAFDFLDVDQDGFPDELEPALGLNPGLPDTDGDGILDGNEDTDNDRLTNIQEVLILSTDPGDNDTDNDLIIDGNEDPDLDSLVNYREFEVSTNPLLADTDRDSWNDETEVISGSYPLDPESTPFLLISARPPVAVAVGSNQDLLATGIVTAKPAVTLSLGGSEGTISTGVILGRPPIAISLPGRSGLLSTGTVTVKPPINLSLLDYDELIPHRSLIAQPPIRIEIQNQP